MSHRHSVTENPVEVVGIAAIAALTGAAVAMLLTPRSGEQLRGGLRRRAGHLKDKAQDHFDVSDDTVDEAKQRLQSTAEKVVSDAKSTVEKAKDDTKEVAKSADKQPPSRL